MKKNGAAANASAGESSEARRRRARRVSRILRRTYHMGTALKFRNPFELLVATILSAQATDEAVNEVTPRLFARYPNAAALAGAGPAEVEAIVHKTGFFRQKTRSIMNCARALAERHGGRVPESMDDLTALPGVGRKTANLVRACAMGRPGLIVDTHFKRVAGRLDLTAESDPDKIEADVAALLPEEEWTDFSNALIWHGRRCCSARGPNCPGCPVLRDCPYGQTATAEGV
ncbi:MAG: endonuclease III [bacterium]|nr:endonuclease III [bacterium]